MKASSTWRKLAYEQIKERQEESGILEPVTMDSRLDYKADYIPCEHRLAVNGHCLHCGLPTHCRRD